VRDTEPIDKEAQLEIERQVSNFVRDFERRSGRIAKLGCFWLMFVVLGAVGMRHTGSFSTWGFLTIASFVALNFILRNETRRAIAEFQMAFRATAGDARRREIALHQLWSMAQTPGRMPNKAAKKLLEGLGLSTPPPTPVIRTQTEDDLRPAFPGPASLGAASDSNARTGMHTRSPGPSDSAALPRVSPPRSAPPSASSPSRTAPAPAASPSRPAPSPPLETSAHAPSPPSRPEFARGAEIREPQVPSVLGPSLVPAPEIRAPAATPPAVVDELMNWRCDACGTEARVPRAEAHRLCPICFPQIRLDG
jgi:hypothetical protein